MTLLNTVSNLGGTWPKYFVLLAVEYMTIAPCSLPALDGTILKCTTQKAKDQCIAAGGTFSMVRDGFYHVNTICILFGVVSLVLYIAPRIKMIEKMKVNSWKLKHMVD